MFDKVLIANRGAIACRIIRTLRKMGMGSVAVYSEADRAFAARAPGRRSGLHRPGRPAAAESYLRAEKILDAAKATGAQAIHPGYGFLCENAGFAEACAAAGIVFIGPTPGADARLRPQAHRARAGRAQRCAAAAGHRPAGRCWPRTGRSARDRLPGDAQEHGGRRRHRHAPVLERERTGGGLRRGRSAWRAPTSRTPASSWRSMSSRRATSRCRFSATARAAWWRWASAIARCSAATRR